MALCKVCGTPVYVSPWEEHFRLCATHLRAARAAAPPIACTSEDIDRGMAAMEGETIEGSDG